MITLNEEGIKILSRLLTQMKKVIAWNVIEFILGPTGIIVNTGQSKISAVYVILGNELIEKNTFKKIHICQLRIPDLASVFTKATSFDTITLKVKDNDIIVNMTDLHGLNNTGIIPLEYAHEGRIEPLQIQKILAAERFEFKVHSKTTDLIMSVLKSYTKGNDDLFIKKDGNLLIISAAVDRWKNEFVLDTRNPDEGLYWLEGVDDSILTFYSGFDECLHTLVPDIESTFNIVPDKAILIQQISDSFSISLGLAAKQQEVEEEEFDEEEDRYGDPEYNPHDEDDEYE